MAGNSFGTWLEHLARSRQNVLYMDDYARLAAITTLRDIFRPSSPTSSQTLFRGRKRELRSVANGLAEAGQHVVIFGERGVGKTSLSFVASEEFKASSPVGSLVVRVQCTDGDTFDTVWRSFYRELQAELLLLDRQVRSMIETVMPDVESLLVYPDQDLLTSPIVSAALRRLASVSRILIVIDEFDRLGGVAGAAGFSDLIKTLSDSGAPITLMIVGVADNVTGLISSHLSVERNLRQVAMPMMTDQEIDEIVLGGFAEFRTRTGLELSPDAQAVRTVTGIAKGFPYYAHLLAGAAGIEAINTSQEKVESATVFRSMLRAVEDASHAIRSKYVDATMARPDSKIELALLACALTPQDQMGYFSSTDVARELSAVLKMARTPAHVNSHLARLSEGPSYVLEQRRFSEKRIRYRFRDPLMRPFVLMKGYENGQIPGGS